MISSLTALAASGFVAVVAAHGNITFPAARQPGPAMVSACGQEAVNNVLADPTIPLEDVFNAKSTCRLDLCRGAVFQDNTNRVSVFSPGQVIAMKAILPIPHEGPMNVSIVKTATNTILGEALIVFDSYADENLPVLPANNTDFSITIPTNLAGAADCRVAGECVLQWFWFGTGAKQTYESCVDFVIGSPARNGSARVGGGGQRVGIAPPVAAPPVLPGAVAPAPKPPARVGPPAAAAPVPFFSPAIAPLAPLPAAPLAAPPAAAAPIPAGAPALAPAPAIANSPAAPQQPIEAKVDATPLAQQPADVMGGVVGTISVGDAAPQKKRKREFRERLAAGILN